MTTEREIMKKYSYLFLGIMIGVMLTASVGAYAATKGYIGKKISSEMTVYVDGQKLADAAIVVEGKSFLPVRKTSEVSGLNLELKNNSIYLQSKEQQSNGGVDPVEPSGKILLNLALQI
jgi:hypothetical protein